MANVDVVTDLATQDAVLWPATVDAWGRQVPGDAGQPSFGRPKAVKVYWMDVVEEFTDAGGLSRRSKAKVFVLEDVTTGSVLFKGKLEDVPAGLRDRPLQVPFASAVARSDKMSDFDGDVFRVCYL